MTRDEYGKAYHHGFEPTVRLLRSRGVPIDSATEMAQAAWTRGWERLSQLRNDSRVEPWVKTIALNVYRTVLRREPLYQALPELCGKVGVDLAAIDVAQILKICRPSDRALLEQQMHGVTAEEVARQLGVPVPTVRLRLYRARRKARKSVEGRGSQVK